MINKEFSEIVVQLFGGANKPLQQSIWRPRADVYRYAQGWLIKIEFS